MLFTLRIFNKSIKNPLLEFFSNKDNQPLLLEIFTQEQIDLTEDTSQMMEFPDYVCQEIINELVHIVMENSSDPRMQTHPAFS